MFTLDTNCWIAVENGDPEALHVRALADAHTAGTAHVALVGISASEKQKGGHYVKNVKEFLDRQNSLGLAHLNILKPMAYFDITFWDWCLLTGPEMEALEKKVHDILFPNIEFKWCDYCAVNNLDPNIFPSGKWRNCKCDVQAMWCHIHNKREVFVTTDKNFHTAAKKPTLLALGAGQILCPEDAAALL